MYVYKRIREKERERERERERKKERDRERARVCVCVCLCVCEGKVVIMLFTEPVNLLGLVITANSAGGAQTDRL